MAEWDVPGYTELKALGSGGFGDVVLARHDPSGTLVAIKFLRRHLLDDPEFAEMFRSEAAVLASVDDPNGLFNSSLEGKTRRAIDFREGEKIDEAAFKQLIRAAAATNTAVRAQQAAKKK